MKRVLTEMEMFRAQELLMQRATEGLDPHEVAELAALGAEDDPSFDLAATSIDLATLHLEEMPRGVADKLLLAAGVAPVPYAPQTLAGFVAPRPIHVSPRPAEVPVPPPQPSAPDLIPIERALRRRTRIAITAVTSAVAIAACAILYVATREAAVTERVVERIVEVPAKPPVVKPLAEQRAELLATAGDVTTLAWTATADPNAAGATGDVVWSKSRQQGYMRFTGLAANDATKLQYQLWIFDKNRPQETPVDGGVFDVASTGEVIVPITARLSVDEPVLFAVTIERPGGVVVSKRERIVVTAAPKAS